MDSTSCRRPLADRIEHRLVEQTLEAAGSAIVPIADNDDDRQRWSVAGGILLLRREP